MFITDFHQSTTASQNPRLTEKIKMKSESSVIPSSIQAHAPDEQGPHFKPQNSPPDGPVISVLSNEVVLLPFSKLSRSQKIEVTVHQSLSNFLSGQRDVADDLIILTSRAGVIFGRMPNKLSDTGFKKWLESFIDYISHHEQAAWWHADFSGQWACFVLVPMNKSRKRWLYPNTRNHRSRPFKILRMLDTYAESKPWVLNLPGQQAESRVAEVFGICYVPRRGQDAQYDQKKQPWEPPTEIRFVWDPEQEFRELWLKDEVSKEEHSLLERVDMCLL